MLPTIHIGPLVFPTAGLIYIFGAWVSLSLVEKAAVRLRQDHLSIYALAVTGLFAGIIGARLLFVAQYWPAFRENLLGVIWPLNTGYNAWGGLLIGLAAAFFYGRLKQLPPAATLDALAAGLISGLMVISLADFLGGPGYGKLTIMPWGIAQFGVRRHPVQLYELLVGAAALAAWWRASGRRMFDGQLFLWSTAVYSAGRLFVEAYRDNAWLTAGGLRVGQLLCLATLLLALFLLGYLNHPTSQKDQATSQ